MWRFTINSPIPAQLICGSWQASLELQLGPLPGGRVGLRHKRHTGPLYLQKAFYPEGDQYPHLYILHPPGGVVSGDSLEVGVEVAGASGALLTTPGAGRFYRARETGTIQSSRTRLLLHDGAALEWLPQENIVYPDASAELCTSVELGPRSRFIGWEINVLGLPASQQEFASGRLRQLLKISVGGRVRLVEQQWLDMARDCLFGGAAGMRALPVNAVMVAGPFPDRDVLGQLVHQLQTKMQAETGEQGFATDLHWGLTCHGEFLIARVLGREACDARALFVSLWRVLRPALLGRPACVPRVWAT